MRSLLTIVAIVLTLPAVAQSVRFDPPAPDSRTAITMEISGIAANGCPPSSGQVTRSGATIRVTLAVLGPVCPTSPMPYRVRVELGVLPPGVYRVQVVLAPSPSTTFAEARLIVREAEPALTVVPNVIFSRPATVRIRGEGIGTCRPNVSPCTPPILRVLFNNEEAPTVRILSADEIEAVLPATDAVAPTETYTVTVIADDGRRLETIAAFSLTSPNGLADPALFERVLIPVAFSGPGAFGAQWTTVVSIENASEEFVRLFRTQLQVNCPIPEGCPRDFLLARDTAQLMPRWPTGRFIYAARENALRYNIVVKDVSRQAEAFGTEVPVVREDDWSSGPIHLLNVPADRRFRTALRVYRDDDASNFTYVPLRISRMGSNTPIVVTTLPLDIAHDDVIPSTNWIADLTTQLAIPPGEPLQIEIAPPPGGGRIWAFATVTNNDTQHVTVISPQ